LAADQVDAVVAVATWGRLLDVLVGPAGTGKTTTLRALRAAWETGHGRGSVIGLAPSANAAHELAASVGIGCETISKWLTETTGPAAQQRASLLDELTSRRATATNTGNPAVVRRLDAARAAILRSQAMWRLRPRQLVIVDEASLAGTLDLDRLRDQAARAGAKLLVVGDHAQLCAVDAGGAFGLLARTGTPPSCGRCGGSATGGKPTPPAASATATPTSSTLTKRMAGCTAAQPKPSPNRPTPPGRPTTTPAAPPSWSPRTTTP
jgi:AAA domain